MIVAGCQSELLLQCKRLYQVFVPHSKFRRTKVAVCAASHHRNNQNRQRRRHTPEQNKARLGSGRPPRVRLGKVTQSHADTLPVASERAPYLIAGRLPPVPPCVNQMLR